jgi:RNAse (barnase) inhibitor barstar
MYKRLFVCKQYKYGDGEKLLSVYLTISADKILTLVTNSLQKLYETTKNKKHLYDVSQGWIVLPLQLLSKNVKVKNAKVQNTYFTCSSVWI